MIPSDLKFPNPQMPWSINQGLFGRLQPHNTHFKAAVLLPTDKESTFISNYFMASKPPGYSIARISCVYNDSLHRSFVDHLSRIEEEGKKFPSTWHTESLPEKRKQVIESWKALTYPFSPLTVEGEETLNHAKVLPLWYGASSNRSQAICSTGFTQVRQKGYFGNGMYFTDSAHFASMNNKGFLLLSWVSMREPYPVVTDTIPPRTCTDITTLRGKGAYLNYDAHFIPVASFVPNSTDLIDYFPCTQKPDWNQIVVFQKFQALPSFIIELEADLFLSPIINRAKKEELPKDVEGHYCKKLLQAKRDENVQEQIHYVEKLGDIYLEKQNWVTAAKILNGALAIVEKHKGSPTYFLKKLKHIETLFLASKGFKTLPQHESILHFRTQLKKARALSVKAFQEGKSIQEVARSLTLSYKELLSDLILDSQKVLGPPPIDWSCVGMGSMARNEMCPYSDLEFAFLIGEKTETNLQYFRSLAGLLELRIINCGETKFPLFGNLFGETSPNASPTPSGFCMDSGGNTPLGKPGLYELINTPEGLAQFQSLNKKKADIIVTNALSLVSHIAGDKTLSHAYDRAKEAKLNTNATDDTFCFPFRKELAIKLLEGREGHVEDFKPKLSKEKQEDGHFDIKKELYRPLQSVIGALTLFCGLRAESSFEMIEQLYQNKYLSLEGAKNLSNALLQALALRFEAHSFYNNEEESLLHIEAGKPQDPHYLYLEETRLVSLLEIYKVLIPFHLCGEEFVKVRDPEIFRNFPFYDENPSVQGEAYGKMLQYEKAQIAWQQAVSLNPNDIDAQLNLGIIERQMGKCKEFLSRNLQALSLAQKKYGENHPTVADCYNSAGLAYQALGQYVKALEFFKTALEISLQVQAENHPNVAASYSNIGATYKDLGQYTEALKFCHKALEIQLKVLGKNHPHVSASYTLIGGIHLTFGKYNKALEFFEKDLDILLILNKSHPDIAQCYNNIGFAYYEMGNYREALTFYTKALEVSLKFFGENHPAVATIHNNIGLVHRSSKDYNKARDSIEKSLKIRIKVLGEKHPETAKSHGNIGLVYHYLNKNNEALKSLEKGLQILLPLQEEHEEVATIYHNLGLVYDSLGDYSKALEYYQKDLKISCSVLGENHPSVATTYISIGALHYNGKDFTKALEFYEKGLQIQLQFLGENHPSLAVSYNNSGHAYHHLGKFQEALALYQKALNIDLNALRANHPSLAKSYQLIGDVSSKLGQFESASEAYNKALGILLPLYGPGDPRVQSLYASINQITQDVLQQDIEEDGCCFCCCKYTCICLFFPCIWCCFSGNTEESKKLISG